MRVNKFPRLALMALSIAAIGHVSALYAADDEGARHPRQHTLTPIEHVIVIMGENHTFDNLYGGYRPPHGEKIKNLLSQGIIKADGSPGPNFSRAAQQQASNPNLYMIDPSQTGPYATLPQPNTTYATGQTPGLPDPRFPANLANGPFQITQYVPYDAHVGDPVHRFFQMWQQNNKGRNDLFTWVAETVGIGPQNHPPLTPSTTNQGGVAMGFYNMSTGDAPYFKHLAED